MALNLKNVEVERLAAEVAKLSSTSLTGAVLDALRLRKEQLLQQQARKKGAAQAREFLAREFWSQLPPSSRETDDAILGYGDSGA